MLNNKQKVKIKTTPVVAQKIVVPPPKFRISSTAMSPTITRISDHKKAATPALVFYAPKVKETIDYLVAMSPKEIGWLGLVSIEEYGYLITEVFIPKQTVTGAETDISADAMSDLATELLATDKDPGALFYWGHSHVNMHVSPSGQDERQTAEYLEHLPFFIRGIYNKHGDSKVDIYDVNAGICYQCVPNNTLNFGLSFDTTKHIDALLKANVTEQIFTTFSKKTISPDRYFLLGDGQLENMYD